jgi:DNA transformation protein
MFGGHCLYCDGVVFALVAGGTLYLKVDELTRLRVEELGLKPFQPYETKVEVMQYYQPPPEFFEEAALVLDWGVAAVEAGRRAGARANLSRSGGTARPE